MIYDGINYTLIFIRFLKNKGAYASFIRALDTCASGRQLKRQFDEFKTSHEDIMCRYTMFPSRFLTCFIQWENTQEGVEWWRELGIEWAMFYNHLTCYNKSYLPQKIIPITPPKLTIAEKIQLNFFPILLGFGTVK